MGLRFYRRVHLLPGVRLNVGTRGASVSFGARGAWYTVGPHGRRTATLGFPGTGIRYTTTAGGAGSRREPLPSVPPAPSAAGGFALVMIILLVGIVIGLAMR